MPRVARVTGPLGTALRRRARGAAARRTPDILVWVLARKWQASGGRSKCWRKVLESVDRIWLDPSNELISGTSVGMFLATYGTHNSAAQPDQQRDHAPRHARRPRRAHRHPHEVRLVRSPVSSHAPRAARGPFRVLSILLSTLAPAILTEMPCVPTRHADRTAAMP